MPKLTVTKIKTELEQRIALHQKLMQNNLGQSSFYYFAEHKHVYEEFLHWIEEQLKLEDFEEHKVV